MPALQALRAAWQCAAAYLLVPLGHFAGAKFGVLYTVMPEGTAILWPPNSVLLAALLLRRGRGALPLSLLVIAAEVAADVPAFSLTEALLFGLVNVSEALLAYGILSRCSFDPRFGRLHDLNCFLLAAPAVAALAAAFAGAAVYSHFRGTEVSYLPFVRIWWFGDALGLLVFTPLVLGLAQGVQGSLARWRGWPPGDWLTLALAAGAVGVFFASHHAVLDGLVFAPVLLLPFALLLASRFGLAVVCAGSAAMAMTLIVTLTQGRHPFGPLPAREEVLRTQEFVFILGLVPLGLGALLAQLRSRQRELESANECLNTLNRELDARVRERTARLDALNADLRRLALLDPLTGLANRRAFFDRARQAFEHCRRHPAALSV
ncbi:MAG TPA: MASE1 domain-containing protein, partial [Albitalea sp.]|nr:MASE1 domain-containing protein [Albitalea sp.]